MDSQQWQSALELATDIIDLTGPISRHGFEVLASTRGVPQGALDELEREGDVELHDDMLVGVTKDGRLRRRVPRHHPDGRTSTLAEWTARETADCRRQLRL